MRQPLRPVPVPESPPPRGGHADVACFRPPGGLRRAAMSGRSRIALAMAVSAALHAAVGLLGLGTTRLPESEFELALPSEIELGLVGEDGEDEGGGLEEALDAPADAPAPPETGARTPEPGTSEPSAATPDGMRDAGVRDAGRPDAGTRDAGPGDAAAEDAGLSPDAAGDEGSAADADVATTPEAAEAGEAEAGGADGGGADGGPALEADAAARVAAAPGSTEDSDGGVADGAGEVAVAASTSGRSDNADSGVIVAAADGAGGAGAGGGGAGAAGGGAGGGAGATGTGSGRRRSGPGLAAYAPPGAQIALRLDLSRVRVSPYVGDVRAVISGIPDWQLLLEGSGIEPLDELDRLLIASPDLQRAHLVMSGRYVGSEARVRAAVAALAAARGTEAPWRVERGVPVARWANADATERVIALVGPNAFTITRPADLPRVLAIARARRREARAAARSGEPLADDADALLWMEAGEVASLEVDNARVYARGGTRGVPERLRVSLVEREGARAHVTAEGRFESEEAADAALAYWERMLAGYRRNAFARLAAAHALDSVTLRRDGTSLVAEVDLDPREIRLALSYLRGLLERPR